MLCDIRDTVSYITAVCYTDTDKPRISKYNRPLCVYHFVWIFPVEPIKNCSQEQHKTYRASGGRSFINTSRTSVHHAVNLSTMTFYDAVDLFFLISKISLVPTPSVFSAGEFTAQLSLKLFAATVAATLNYVELGQVLFLAARPRGAAPKSRRDFMSGLGR